MRNFSKKLALFTSSSVLGLGIATSAWAQVKSFDIPAEDALKAIPEFARQAGVQIIAPGDQLRGVRTTAIKASLDTRIALAQILAGTGAQVASNDGQTIVLRVASKNVQAASNDGAALASDPDAPEQVVITATRIEREGFVAPTPTTILTATDLQVGGATNLGTALTSLPSYAPTVSQATTRQNVDTGQNTANLLALGPTRTLVLIDGTRPVATAPGGSSFGFDLNMVPFFLIDHVEVVTGGASAQWGSDAVAGVVNVVMSKSLDGLKAEVQYGGDTDGLGSQEFKTDLAYGTSFDGDRGHVMFGAGYDNIGGVYWDYNRPVGNSGLIPNPNYTATNGQPQALFAQGLLNSTASIGGVITAGPLKGTEFGPGGSVGIFQYGQYGLNTTSGGLMIGGDPSARYYTAGYGPLISPLTRENFYGRATYDLTDHTMLTLDLLVGREESTDPYTTSVYLGTLTIQNTNAYLPPQIASAMAANKITSFALGRDNEDFGPIFNHVFNNTQQFKLGAQGDFGDAWSWDAFYSYGATERKDTVGPEPIAANLANSVNAVISPTTGQPVCAIALTNPATNCVPVNLFGSGSVSAAALAYFEGNSAISTLLYQHEAGANLRGEPFSLWAGPVSIATGLEFRNEGVQATADAITQAKGFGFLNVAYLSPGTQTVTEGYLETVVPLVRGVPALQKLDFDGAVRVSGYSNSGVIPSWKLGLTDSVTSELLIKGAVSRDIRAPNLQEMFTGQTTAVQTVTNPLTNTAYPGVQVYGGGNPSLNPELATTFTGGAVYRPEWLTGLNLSLDYYSINIQNAINTVAAQTLVNQCYSSNIASACSEITTVNGAITTIQGTYINIASYKASGLNFEADYGSDLDALNLPGAFRIKWLGSYVAALKQVTGTTTVPLAGSIASGLPRWRSTGTINYTLDPFELFARLRYVGGGAYTLTQTVNTGVSAQAYVDLGLQWKLPIEQKITVYANVNNLFDNVYAQGSADSPGLFDYLGRTYNVGLRLAL